MDVETLLLGERGHREIGSLRAAIAPMGAADRTGESTRDLDGHAHRAVMRAVEQAVDAPLDFPPLAATLTPDDHVAIALGEATPAAAAIVSALVGRLGAAGIAPGRIAVVAPTPRDARRVSDGVAPLLEAGLVVETHDADDATRLCFAGLTAAERPLLVNRRLFEADVVLPVSAERTADGYHEGAYGGVFPDLFDRATIDRLRSVRRFASLDGASGDAHDQRVALRRETDEAGWLLGAPLVVRVVPGSGGGVEAVVAGAPDAVARRAAEAGRAAWRTDAPKPASLVVAVLGGSVADQTWAEVGRALAAAERALAPGGSIALWSELDEQIGAAMGLLVGADDRERAAFELADATGAQAWAAWRLLAAVERGPVFFRSRMDDELIEELGLAPLHDADELLRLASRHATSLVLTEAQHLLLGGVE